MHVHQGPVRVDDFIALCHSDAADGVIDERSVFFFAGEQRFGGLFDLQLEFFFRGDVESGRAYHAYILIFIENGSIYAVKKSFHAVSEIGFVFESYARPAFNAFIEQAFMFFV